MRAETYQLLVQIGSIREDHAALTGGDYLDGVETQDGRIRPLAATYRAPLVSAADGVRCVFDNGYAAGVRQTTNFLHGARLAGEVHGNYDGRPLIRMRIKLVL